LRTRSGIGRWLPLVLTAVVLGVLAVALAVRFAGPTAASDPSTTPEATVAADVFAACESCHADYLAGPTSSPGLVFDHQTHLARGAACVDCHAGAAGHQGSPVPRMAACFACHEGRKASKDCAYCHSNLDEIAPGYGEPTVHVVVDPEQKASCARCHDVATFCADCHGLEIPHPAGWSKDHGQIGQNQSSVCVKCHQSRDGQFCVRCHGMEMPHPQYWYSEHASVATPDPKACNLCHRDAPVFCDRCHQTLPKTGSGG
jgi:hypothetical protein